MWIKMLLLAQMLVFSEDYTVAEQWDNGYYYAYGPGEYNLVFVPENVKAGKIELGTEVRAFYLNNGEPTLLGVIAK